MHFFLNNNVKFRVLSSKLLNFFNFDSKNGSFFKILDIPMAHKFLIFVKQY